MERISVEESIPRLRALIASLSPQLNQISSDRGITQNICCELRDQFALSQSLLAKFAMHFREQTMSFERRAMVKVEQLIVFFLKGIVLFHKVRSRIEQNHPTNENEAVATLIDQIREWV